MRQIALGRSVSLVAGENADNRASKDGACCWTIGQHTRNLVELVCRVMSVMFDLEAGLAVRGGHLPAILEGVWGLQESEKEV